MASCIVGWIVVGLIAAVDWAAVGSALGQLQPWQLLPLLGFLLLRQTLGAVPLAQFVPGLGLARSVRNDLTANLVATVTPPPADVVLRVSMFRSWQIDPVHGMAGVTLNMLTFYAVRFLAPTVGLMFLAFQGIERGQLVAALGCAVVAAAILTGLILLARGDRFAAMLGRTAAQVAGRIPVGALRDGADQDRWALAVTNFRARMADTLRAGLPTSLVALIGMVLCDATILLLALRFAGVDPSALSAIDVIGAFLLAYPLTLLPLFGFGVLDAALFASWTAITGELLEPEIVAGLMIWRIVTILGPLLLGGSTLLLWRRATKQHGATGEHGAIRERGESPPS